MPVATVSEPEKMETTFDHLDEGYEFHFVKKLDEDIKLEPDQGSPKKEVKDPIELFETAETHVDKQLKLNDGKAKKIRRLDVDNPTEKRRYAQNQRKGFFDLRKFFLITALSAVALFFLSPDLRDELIQKARKEYNVIVQGASYCTDKLDSTEIMQELREHIVGQDHALASIERALQSDESFKSLIFYGPTGTGKTLSSQLLQAKFRWQENVQILIHNPDAKFDLNSITSKMSTCGYNLLIIDDLYPFNLDMLNIKKVLQDTATSKGFKLILVFIFNVSKDTESLGAQQDHYTIEYRRLTETNLDECMDRIEKELSVTLSEEQRDAVKASVDINKHGCKNVRSKVSLYA